MNHFDGSSVEHYLERELTSRMAEDPLLFHFLRQAALDGLWYLDLTAPENEWMDDRFWITLGYDPSTKPHRAEAWQELIHPEDLAKSSKNLAQHLADPNHPYDQLVRYRHASGSTVWVRCRGLALRDERGQPVRMLGAHVDVTQLQQLRARLEAKNQDLESSAADRARQLRQLIEGIPLLVWTCEPEGPCDYLSPQWVAYTGVPEAQQLGGGWIEQLHPEDIARTAEAWNASVSEGKPLDIEFRIRRFDGEYRWFKTRANPLRGDDGRVVKWFGTNTDIHDKKVLEDELRQRTAALERSNAELEQFAYVASHDLQEPLRTVASYVQLLERRYGHALDQAGREYISYVSAGARKMHSLIVDLLDYSRATMGPREGADVSDMGVAMQEALGSLEASIRETHTTLDVAPLPKVVMQPAALVHVLQNLLSNAIQYGSEQSPRVEVRCDRNNGWVTLSIRDNGIGIAPEHHRKIFQMFQRLHPESGKPGTGVGLALCKRLVEAADGEIWVESQVGAGATFFVRLKEAMA